jgi:1,4-dihydroxy-6-naphthoate synthase
MLDIAISPCPNDTFLFYAWLHGKVEGPSVQATYYDVQNLNQESTKGSYPVMKISAFHYKAIQDKYILLNTGAALGYNCGPKLISSRPIAIEDIHKLRVAIPGKDTTAHALFNLLCPTPKAKAFCLYNEIEAMLKNREVDAGLIIHETRFTFLQSGFHEVADLGEMWHKRFSLPLPLGVIVAKRSLPQREIIAIEKAMQASLQYAWAHPHEAIPFMQTLSQEIQPDVMQNHVDLYVSKETMLISDTGKHAITTLLEAGTSPSSVKPIFFEGALCPT